MPKKIFIKIDPNNFTNADAVAFLEALSGKKYVEKPVPADPQERKIQSLESEKSELLNFIGTLIYRAELMEQRRTSIPYTDFYESTLRDARELADKYSPGTSEQIRDAASMKNFGRQFGASKKKK